MTALVVLALQVVGCTAAAPVAVVTGRVEAGPVCPVETDPHDPNCAPHPVAGTTISFKTAGGDAAVATSGDDGFIRIEIPVGTVLVTPQPVDGLLGTPEPFEVEVTRAGADLGTLEYDTGIR